jgi:cation diffusion facilitator family transporter
MAEHKLRGAMLLSILAGVTTLVLKMGAYLLTGSVGLLSDALESLVNLLAATVAYLAVRYSHRPVDLSHTYGHEKIEFFSSGLEGGLILIAAVIIAWCAVARLITPQPPEQLGLGMFLSVLAAGVNGSVGLLLVSRGRKHHSIVLEADGLHLLTDVWTTAAVLVGLGLVWMTGASVFDPLTALLMAAGILWTGWSLMRRSFNGLMDHALPDQEQEVLRRAIESHLRQGMTYHALRTRQAGARRFVDFHLLVPGSMTVADSHVLSDAIEHSLRTALPNVEPTIHVEPVEHLSAWQDSALLSVEASPKPNGE